MNNEFIPFEQALALKELGFDEPCFKKYIAGCLWSNPTTPEVYKNIHANSSDCLTPLYQQAFRWFRDKYYICSWVYQVDKNRYFFSQLKNGRYLVTKSSEYNTYEEAELECLKRLIEIVKSK